MKHIYDTDDIQDLLHARKHLNGVRDKIETDVAALHTIDNILDPLNDLLEELGEAI